MKASKELELLRGLPGHLLDEGCVVWAGLIKSRADELIKDEPVTVTMTMTRETWDVLLVALAASKQHAIRQAEYEQVAQLRDHEDRIRAQLKANVP